MSCVDSATAEDGTVSVTDVGIIPGQPFEANSQVRNLSALDTQKIKAFLYHLLTQSPYTLTKGYLFVFERRSILQAGSHSV